MTHFTYTLHVHAPQPEDFDMPDDDERRKYLDERAVLDAVAEVIRGGPNGAGIDSVEFDLHCGTATWDEGEGMDILLRAAADVIDLDPGARLPG